jgi:hypothetical protein
LHVQFSLVHWMKMKSEYNSTTSFIVLLNLLWRHDSYRKFNTVSVERWFQVVTFHQSIQAFTGCATCNIRHNKTWNCMFCRNWVELWNIQVQFQMTCILVNANDSEIVINKIPSLIYSTNKKGGQPVPSLLTRILLLTLPKDTQPAKICELDHNSA